MLNIVNVGSSKMTKGITFCFQCIVVISIIVKRSTEGGRGHEGKGVVSGTSSDYSTIFLE